MLTLALALYAVLVSLAFLVVAVGGMEQRDDLRRQVDDLDLEADHYAAEVRRLRTELAWSRVDYFVDEYARDVAAIRELPEVER